MLQDCKLRISLVQYDIAWENKQKNLDYIHTIVSGLEGKTDVIILPEMCTTGFSMNSRNLAEPLRGTTITLLKQWAAEYDVAICGSFIAKENTDFYNRGFFITPDKEFYYDKRHLFRMGAEPQSFSAGGKRLIFEHKGFNICLLICYDLRFPVWARNIDNEYDLLIYTANWPASRAKVWNALLMARALENMTYVCGVNRIGKDGNGLIHEGCSKVIDAKGNEILSLGTDLGQVGTVCISKLELEQFRAKFPVWKDADRFELK
ncbi:MAG: nitrilase family protein [Prevotella sp.]|uniref:nitrilase family protein n=1 Tax=unclassified Dysgonomonas TaxID=2630389 RepID=UPI0025B877D4|nr:MULTISPECIES: nitrilase family protein [unclassified Dysgonomonas]MDR1715004.1 nitrilase family protein [Prevotella sp.]MDR2001516.1 nitrilase family protein [Prevotella sp.]HMM03089.1 nitrilase family protein [Dysgonomonas sp.]